MTTPKCQECARLRKEAKERLRKLQLKRLAQTLASAVKIVLTRDDSCGRKG